jgi:hypothetical protein
MTLDWHGDDNNGWIAFHDQRYGRSAYTVVRVSFRGSDHFEARHISHFPEDADGKTVRRLASAYGLALPNRSGGLRRTLDPVATVTEAKAQAQADYNSRTQ